MAGLFDLLLRGVTRHPGSEAREPEGAGGEASRAGGAGAVELRGGYQVLQERFDADITRALIAQLDRRLGELQAGVLEAFRSSIASTDSRRERLADAVTSSANRLIDQLVLWPDIVSTEMHALFTRDRKSVLEEFQATAANNVNYQFLIESQSIAAAHATFTDALMAIEAQWPAVASSALADVEGRWSVEWLLLHQRSHWSLEREARKALRTGESQPIVDLLDFSIRDAVSRGVDLIWRSRLWSRHEASATVEWSPFVDRARISEVFQRRFTDAQWPDVEVVAARWAYVAMTIENERANVAAKILQDTVDNYGDWINTGELEAQIGSMVDARVREGFDALADTARGLARAQIEAVLGKG